MLQLKTWVPTFRGWGRCKIELARLKCSRSLEKGRLDREVFVFSHQSKLDREVFVTSHQSKLDREVFITSNGSVQGMFWVSSKTPYMKRRYRSCSLNASWLVIILLSWVKIGSYSSRNAIPFLDHSSEIKKLRTINGKTKPWRSSRSTDKNQTMEKLKINRQIYLGLQGGLKLLYHGRKYFHWVADFFSKAIAEAVSWWTKPTNGLLLCQMQQLFCRVLKAELVANL